MDNKTEIETKSPPIKDLDNLQQWKDRLLSDVEFKGDVENASILLTSLEKGLNYALADSKTKTPITILALADENKSKSFISYNLSPYGKDIFVKKSFLITASNHDPSTNFSFTTSNGEVAFRGSFKNFFELTGVEEGDHSTFENFQNGVIKAGENKTVAEYDAQEHEYRALKSQIEYASENMLPEETLVILRKRLVDAQKYRSKEKVD